MPITKDKEGRKWGEQRKTNTGPTKTSSSSPSFLHGGQSDVIKIFVSQGVRYLVVEVVKGKQCRNEFRTNLGH